MTMMFWRLVACLASLTEASTASEPLFQKKNVSREGSGMMGSSSRMSWTIGEWNAMLHWPCTSCRHCAAAASLTTGWQWPFCTKMSVSR